MCRVLLTCSSPYAENGKPSRRVLSSSLASMGSRPCPDVFKNSLWDEGGTPVMGSSFAFS